MENNTAADVINKWAGAIRNCREDEKIKDYFGANNKIILLTRPYSMHPDDWYLSVVMAYLPENDLHPYVTWMHNSSFPENPDYYFSGNYFQTKEEAFEDWKKR
jgi:hypothetical protein